MSVQALLISVAVTCLAVGICFFYFRNRMNKTEQKVDLMFQLIQEHERNSRMNQQIHMQQQMQHKDLDTGLINISDNDDDDDDEEYDSDDSREISDTDDDDKLVINESNNLEEVEPAIKTISLSLDGAETSNSVVSVDEIETLEENKEDINLESDDELDNVTLSDNEENNVESDSSSHDGTLQNFVVTKKVGKTETSETSEEAIESDDEESDHSGEKEIDKETIVEEVTNYSKLTKAQLKKLAQDKGFVGYNKLTKTGLVDLLNGNA